MEKKLEGPGKVAEAHWNFGVPLMVSIRSGIGGCYKYARKTRFQQGSAGSLQPWGASSRFRQGSGLADVLNWKAITNSHEGFWDLSGKLGATRKVLGRFGFGG